jgi:hypothetical protein
LKPDLAVTVVCGDDYQAMASMVVPRVQALLGLDVAVELVEPITVEGSRTDTRLARIRACCKAKLQLLDRYPGKRLMFFDPDWVPLRPWDWAAIEAGFDGLSVRRAFVAVRQQTSAGERLNELNGGFWIASPEHRPLFHDASRRWLEQGDPKRWGWDEIFLSQAIGASQEHYLSDALNAALLQVAWLPAAFNLQIGEEHTWSETPMAAHACYARDKAGLVRRLCEEYPLSGYLLRDAHPPFGGPGLAEQLPRDTEPPPRAPDTERAPPP